jgi:hypothetical protein
MSSVGNSGVDAIELAHPLAEVAGGCFEKVAVIIQQAVCMNATRRILAIMEPDDLEPGILNEASDEIQGQYL